MQKTYNHLAITLKLCVWREATFRTAARSDGTRTQKQAAGHPDPRERSEFSLLIHGYEHSIMSIQPFPEENLRRDAV
ncbi:MAG: hypothetical protein K7J47_01010 [Acidobacteria bacterium]|jgi:hypothetical protein|nr:hypothetical protein [Bryobacteraceae bacterium CoA2 C42]